MTESLASWCERALLNDGGSPLKMTDWQREVVRMIESGDFRRLVIMVPPRSGWRPR